MGTQSSVTVRRRTTLLGAAAIAAGLLLAACGDAGGHRATARGAGVAAEPTGVAATQVGTTAPPWLTRALADGVDTRAVPANLTPSTARARYSLPRTYAAPRCHLDVPTVRNGTCRYGDPAGKRTVVLFGDSHAAQWFPAVERVAKHRHWRLVNLTKSSCPAALVSVSLSSPPRPYRECDRWRSAGFDRIEALRPQLVIMASARTAGSRTTAAADRNWYAGTASSVRNLRRSGAQVLVLTDTPHLGSDPAACLARNRTDARRCVQARAATVSSPQQVPGERDAAIGAGATVLDPTDWFCTARCPVVVGRIQVYRDAHHMTTVYANWLGRALDPRLAALVR